ncbi:MULTISPECIES: ABC transporter ATP-binding protein [Anaerolinea]|uniref:ABC transporter ATP-binding protein n=1 Tax=Anaerolinea TaxID=233189 RepID=UPI00260F3E46|nr:ABC transporter ATP-binding protein [Anaerolinea thermophila]
MSNRTMMTFEVASPSTALQPYLRVDDVGMRYPNDNGGIEALRGVQFDLHPREFVCVLGPSGCGKSTLLRIIAGLLTPTHGEVIFYAPAASRISLVFQDANLMPWRNVRENIALPLILQGMPRAHALQKADVWLEIVGLQGFGDALPRELSGGMAQRVAIARSLIQEPGLLLLDEPFGALDALTREKMADELLRLWQEHRTTVLMVTHSISEAILLSDRVLVFSSRPGRVVLDLDVNLPRPREEEMRYTSEFGRLARELRRAITD